MRERLIFREGGSMGWERTREVLNERDKSEVQRERAE